MGREEPPPVGVAGGVTEVVHWKTEVLFPKVQ